MSRAAFISELIRAARNVEGLTMHERAGLLNRAAATIWENRELLDFSAGPSEGPGSVVYDLQRVAERIQQYHCDQVQAALFDATQLLKATLKLLDKQKMEQDSA